MKYESLQEILDFIETIHPKLHSPPGVYCLRMRRTHEGARIPFEELRGVRIKSFEVYDTNTVIATLHSHGMAFKSNRLNTFDGTIYLTDLAMINVYDHSAEFLTNSSIDFVYLEQDKGAKTVMLAEWIHDVPKNLRAQWFKDSETERLLSEVGLGRKVRQRINLGRHLDLE